MNFTARDHTFVVCAYKQNPHLDICIQSLTMQSVKSNIIMSTSTPNEHISSVAQKYNIPVFINPNHIGAGDDWNFGYLHATTALITIVHQDDYYEPDFLKATLEFANKRNDIILLFTDYYELRNDVKIKKNKVLSIKRFINFPLSLPLFWKSKFIRRRTLSIGCAICCPSVTFVKKNAGSAFFNTTYINSCDYKTWVDLSKKSGSFIYIPEKLMGHRIYADSATSLNIKENIRQKEDLEILYDFWPKWIAKIINRYYSKSEESNKI